MKRLIVLAAVLLLAACGGTVTALNDDTALTEIDLLLAFVPDVQFAPYYVGIEKGYFTEAGFDVSITHLQESEIARQVATNPDSIGVIGAQQLLLGRAQGLDLPAVFEWYQRYTIAIAAKEGAGITEPADLAGRVVGVPIREGENYIGRLALLQTQGLSEDDIDLQATGFTQVETLVSDRAEAVVVYAVNEPTQLEARDVPVDVIYVSDYVDLVSNLLIVNSDLIAGSPDRVEAFVGAFATALRDTIDNPDEAFGIATQYVEGLDDPDVAPIARQVLDASVDLWDAEQLGYSELETWVNTQDLLLSADLLTDEQDLEAAFTNAFLP
ncbi:MAG: ABC transporter substrate-binding protein [Anaerolineae bacterium]